MNPTQLIERIAQSFIEHHLNGDDLRQAAFAIRSERGIEHPKDIGNILWKMADWIEELTEDWIEGLAEEYITPTANTFPFAHDPLDAAEDTTSPSINEYFPSNDTTDTPHTIASTWATMDHPWFAQPSAHGHPHQDTDANLSSKERAEGENQYLRSLIHRIHKVLIDLNIEEAAVLDWIQDVELIIQQDVPTHTMDHTPDEAFDDPEPSLVTQTTPGDTIDSAIMYAHGIITKIQIHRISGMTIPDTLETAYEDALNTLRARLAC